MLFTSNHKISTAAIDSPFTLGLYITAANWNTRAKGAPAIELTNHQLLLCSYRPHTNGMVHEVPKWDTDSDWVEEEEEDELDQEPLMVIQDRVKPAELKEMSVSSICRASLLFQSLRAL